MVIWGIVALVAVAVCAVWFARECRAASARQAEWREVGRPPSVEREASSALVPAGEVNVAELKSASPVEVRL